MMAEDSDIEVSSTQDTQDCSLFQGFAFFLSSWFIGRVSLFFFLMRRGLWYPLTGSDLPRRYINTAKVPTTEAAGSLFFFLLFLPGPTAWTGLNQDGYAATFTV